MLAFFVLLLRLIRVIRTAQASNGARKAAHEEEMRRVAQETATATTTLQEEISAQEKVHTKKNIDLSAEFTCILPSPLLLPKVRRNRGTINKCFVTLPPVVSSTFSSVLSCAFVSFYERSV